MICFNPNQITTEKAKKTPQNKKGSKIFKLKMICFNPNRYGENQENTSKLKMDLYFKRVGGKKKRTSKQ